MRAADIEECENGFILKIKETGKDYGIIIRQETYVFNSQKDLALFIKERGINLKASEKSKE
jgi:hypothetical protein